MSSESFHKANGIRYAVATVAHPGEQQSGDAYVVVPTPRGALAGVVDGLGHGIQAAEAAAAAVNTLQQYAGESVIALVRRCHETGKHTRGVVMSLADFNATDHTMTWISVGNVEGLLLYSSLPPPRPRKCVLMRGGVVGDNLPRLQAEILPVSRGDILIFATDGIKRGFEQVFSSTVSPILPLTAPPQEIADEICNRWRKGTDDALVMVVRFCGESR